MILRDWAALIRLLREQPTNVKELIQQPASYKGFVEASKWGVGGVWFGENELLEPLVWFLEWPKEIRANLCTPSNPQGSITILDLELAGILLEFIVLKETLPEGGLQHKSVNILCDNLPAFAGTHKLQTSTLEAAAKLLKALAIRLHATRLSLLNIEHIPGILNMMVDVASRKHSTNVQTFLSEFTAIFAPPQGSSWQILQITNKRKWKVFSVLLQRPSTMESWKQLSKREPVIGSYGPNGWVRSTRSLIPISPGTKDKTDHQQRHTNRRYWRPTACMCNIAAILRAQKRFAPRQSLWRSEPSPQSTNWTDNLTLWLSRKENIHKRSVKLSKVFDEQIPPNNHN